MQPLGSTQTYLSPFSIPKELDGHIVRHLFGKDLANFSLVSPSAHILAGDAAQEQILDAMNLLNKMNLKKLSIHIFLENKIHSLFKRIHQAVSKDSSTALTNYSQILAIYPLIKDAVFHARNNLYEESQVQDDWRVGYPLFLQKCHEFHRFTQELNPEISYKKNVAQLTILNFFANNLDRKEIEKRLWEAKKIEKELREKKMSKETFNDFYVFSPSLPEGNFVLRSIHLEGEKITETLCEHSDWIRGIIANQFYFMKNKMSLLDYDKLHPLFSE
jgi:hypothetical protein